MSQPAARSTDMHVCPLVTPGTPPVPHVGGPITVGAPTVLIGSLPAARVGDMCVCVGPPDAIALGSPTVQIVGSMAARMGDMTSHGGAIVGGLPTVLIGMMGTPAPSAPGVPSPILPPMPTPGGLGAMLKAMLAAIGFGPEPPVMGPGAELQRAVAGVNPGGGTVNCGNIIDAVIARLQGTDPNAAAPNDQDGSFDAIEARHNTTLTWGSTAQAAFDAVQAGGPGTVAIMGIGYSGGTGAHVVVIANDGGTVGIVEAQNWGTGNPPEVITDVARANERYNSDGGSNIGWGIVPPPPK